MERNIIQIPVLTADQLAGAGEARNLYSRGKDTFKIPLDKIYVRAGFNHRLDFGDIRLLAVYLLEGGEVPPIEVDILKDGKAIILAGERRYRAHLLLVSEGHEKFNTMLCFRVPANYSDQERIIHSASSNNNKQFAPLELAELFQDLRVNYGMSNAAIATSTGHNVMHVSNQLRLAGVTDEEKDLIKSGAVSSTAVLDMVKADMPPSARLDAVKEAAGGGEGGSKGKLKVKDVEIMGDLKAKELDKDDTPESLIKGILIHVKALDRLIGTDSKMSDITFKIDAELRMLKTLVTTKYSLIESNKVSIMNDYINRPPTGEVDEMFEHAARSLITFHYTGSGLYNSLLPTLGPYRANLIIVQLVAYGILSNPGENLEKICLVRTMKELEDKFHTIPLNQSDGPF